MLNHSNHSSQGFWQNKEINLFYLSAFIISFASSLINIFVPVYLYKLGFAINYIIFFFWLQSLAFVVFSLIGAKIVSRIGIKRAILASMPFLIAYYLLLNFIEQSLAVFLILPVLFALHFILYNYGYHLNYLFSSDKQKRGREIAFLGILYALSNALAPLIAGLIIAWLDFAVLFIIGASFLILGALVLLITHEVYEPINLDLGQVVNYLRDKRNQGNLLSFTGYAIESTINRVIWPIFLIILLVTADKLGLIVTLSFITSIIIFYLIGKLTDKYDKAKLLKAFTGFYILGWLGRIFATSSFRVLLIDSYKNLTEKILHIPWEAQMYDLAAREKYFVFIVVREIAFNLPRLMILPVIALLFYLNFYPFILTFITAALFSLLYPKLNNTV